MLKTELAEIIRNGENSGVEFKRDHDHADSLAKEIVALLNLGGWLHSLGRRGQWHCDRPHSHRQVG